MEETKVPNHFGAPKNVIRNYQQSDVDVNYMPAQAAQTAYEGNFEQR